MPSNPGGEIPAEPSSEVQEADSSTQAAEVAQLASDLGKLQQDNQQLRDHLLRKQAELENFRKRTEREKQEFLQYTLFEAVKSLLPVLDGFELAMNADASGEEYRKGIGLIHQNLMSSLQKLGLKRVECKGQEFDPRLHEAVATLETAQYPDHQVVEELQPGYSFKDRLMRPAMVSVARRPANETLESTTATE